MSKSYAKSILHILGSVKEDIMGSHPNIDDPDLVPQSIHPIAETPTQGAGTFIYCRDRALLIQASPQQPKPFTWEIPGGHYDEERDKSLLDTAIRETREETGIYLNNKDYLWKKTFDEPNGYIFEVYMYKFDEKPEVYLNSEHVNYIWAAYIDLHKLQLREHIKKLYKKNGLKP